MMFGDNIKVRVDYFLTIVNYFFRSICQIDEISVRNSLVLVHFMDLVEKYFQNDVLSIRTNNGLSSLTWKEIKSIIHQDSYIYMPQQRHMVESHRYILNVASLLDFSHA